MKFEKETLSKAIKAKLTEGGKHLSMSDKTLNDMVNNHYLFATEETELDDFVKKILPVYQSLEGNFNKDIADFTKKWKEEHPDDKPKVTKEDKSGEDDVNAKLLARLEALEKAQTEREEKALLAQKKADLKSKLKEKGVDDDEWVDDYIADLAFDKDTDIDARTEKGVKLFNKSNSHSGKRTPGHAGGAGNDDDDLEDALKSLKSHMGVGASNKE